MFRAPCQLSVHWVQQVCENYLPGGYENMLGAMSPFPISPSYERVLNEIVLPAPFLAGDADGHSPDC